jgi:hypothetical protein
VFDTTDEIKKEPAAISCIYFLAFVTVLPNTHKGFDMLNLEDVVGTRGRTFKSI